MPKTLTQEEIDELRKKIVVPKAKGDEYHICICQTCEDGYEAPWNEFMKHCQEKHGVAKGDAGSKQMQMHLDGAKFFEWRYTCKFGDKVTFLEINRQKRSKADAAMWEG